MMHRKANGECANLAFRSDELCTVTDGERVYLFRDNPLDSGIHELTSRRSQVRNLHRPPIALVSAIASVLSAAAAWYAANHR